MSRHLTALKPGQAGTVCGFTTVDETALRLMHMGVVEGVDIELVRLAPTGDPLEIRVMGYHLSLRRADAEQVLIDPVAP